MLGSVAEVQAVLDRAAAQPPKCMVVDSDLDHIDALIAWIRGDGRWFSLPVVLQVPAATDPVFVQAHQLGADDVLVAGDAGGLTRRLANLAAFDPRARPPLTQGRAIIAQHDEQRRRVLGRIMRQAGFDVAFAAHGEELAQVAGQGDAPALLVGSDALAGGDVLGAVEAARTATGCPELPAVILSTGGDSRELRDRADAMAAVAVTDAAAPADNLLFLANELMRPGVRDVRASTRLLYGTLCGFRAAGSLQPIYGLTYNISREGLYVRTLDPPAPGSVLWFEMRPPHATEAVHLRGKVVWARGMDSPGGAAPPGFGMRIDDASCPSGDLEAYRDGYRALQGARLRIPS